MKGGCDATRKIFAALEVGDKEAAKALKSKARDLFNDVAAAEATKNADLASDGAAMGAEMDYELPKEKIYQGSMAKQYVAICVAKYNAAALPG